MDGTINFFRKIDDTQICIQMVDNDIENCECDRSEEYVIALLRSYRTGNAMIWVRCVREYLFKTGRKLTSAGLSNANISNYISTLNIWVAIRRFHSKISNIIQSETGHLYLQNIFPSAFHKLLDSLHDFICSYSSSLLIKKWKIANKFVCILDLTSRLPDIPTLEEHDLMDIKKLLKRVLLLILRNFYDSVIPSLLGCIHICTSNLMSFLIPPSTVQLRRFSSESLSQSSCNLDEDSNLGQGNRSQFLPPVKSIPSVKANNQQLDLHTIDFSWFPSSTSLFPNSSSMYKRSDFAEQMSRRSSENKDQQFEGWMHSDATPSPLAVTVTTSKAYPTTLRLGSASMTGLCESCSLVETFGSFSKDRRDPPQSVSATERHTLPDSSQHIEDAPQEEYPYDLFPTMTDLHMTYDFHKLLYGDIDQREHLDAAATDVCASWLSRGMKCREKLNPFPISLDEVLSGRSDEYIDCIHNFSYQICHDESTVGWLVCRLTLSDSPTLPDTYCTLPTTHPSIEVYDGCERTDGLFLGVLRLNLSGDEFMLCLYSLCPSPSWAPWHCPGDGQEVGVWPSVVSTSYFPPSQPQIHNLIHLSSVNEVRPSSCCPFSLELTLTTSRRVIITLQMDTLALSPQENREKLYIRYYQGWLDTIVELSGGGIGIPQSVHYVGILYCGHLMKQSRTVGVFKEYWGVLCTNRQLLMGSSRVNNEIDFKKERKCVDLNKADRIDVDRENLEFCISDGCRLWTFRARNDHDLKSWLKYIRKLL